MREMSDDEKIAASYMANLGLLQELTQRVQKIVTEKDNKDNQNENTNSSR